MCPGWIYNKILRTLRGGSSLKGKLTPACPVGTAAEVPQRSFRLPGQSAVVRPRAPRSVDACWPGRNSGDLMSILHGPDTAPGVENKASERMTKRHFPSTSKKKALLPPGWNGGSGSRCSSCWAQVSGLHAGPCCDKCRKRRTQTRTQNSFTPVQKSRHKVKTKPSLLNICWLPQTYFENLLSSECGLLERWGQQLL